MKRKLLPVVISLLLIVGMLAGCVNEAVEAHINDPIAYSGKLEDYAAYDEEALQQRYLEKHIEITGVVSSTGYVLFYIGEYADDSVYFACSFAEHTPALERIEKGAEITVNGVCTSVFKNLITLEGCSLSNEEGLLPPEEDASGEQSEPSGEQTEPSGEQTEPSGEQNTDETAAEATGDEMVWIPTNGGEKYHATADCSDMIDPEYVTKSEAESRSFTACSFCF